jgi:hypothetical protein
MKISKLNRFVTMSLVFMALLLLTLVVLSISHINAADNALVRSKPNVIDNKSDLSNEYLTVTQSNFVDIKSNSSLNLTTFTVAAWFNATQNFQLAPYDTHFIVNKGGLGKELVGYNLNYGIWMTNKGKIQGGFETISNENHFVTTKGEYNDGMWHYVVIAYDGVSLNLYIDGEKVASNLTNVIPDNTGNQPVSVGVNSLTINNFFIGQIDEVRVFNRAVSNKEVEEQYKFGIFNTHGQVLYLPFN